MIYKIAGKTIYLETVSNYITNRIKPFFSEDEAESDMKIRMYEKESISLPLKNCKKNGLIWWCDNDSQKHVFRIREDFTSSFSEIVSDFKWTDVIINYIKPSEDNNLDNYSEKFAFALIGAAFKCYILDNLGITIHGSSIIWRNSGIVFSAPSETGKSTHTKLWKEIYADEVKIINDDAPSISGIDKAPILYGTPWSGRSDVFLNEAAPLKAIVFLEQAKENRIRKINGIEAVMMLIEGAFIPDFDERIAKTAYENIEVLIKKIPMYLLSCTPDKEAVMVVKDELFK